MYPGATLDVNGMKADRSHGQQRMDTAYYTSDSFEKVAAFYRGQSGIVENKFVGKNNSATSKTATFALDNYNISLQWPANVYDGSGNIKAQRGTRIAYVKID
ncbi:MAG: hypothetical protein ACRENC_02540 [Gemmatimonadaceae bacterium]